MGGRSKLSANFYVLFQFIFQAILLMFPAIPLFFVFKHKQNEVPAWYWVGLGVAVIGIIFEAIADQQLYNFIENKKKNKNNETSSPPQGNNFLFNNNNNKDNYIEFLNMQEQHADEENSNANNKQNKGSSTYRGGLWRKSRHPNLFFEFITWVGIAVMGITDLSN